MAVFDDPACCLDVVTPYSGPECKKFVFTFTKCVVKFVWMQKLLSRMSFFSLCFFSEGAVIERLFFSLSITAHR